MANRYDAAENMEAERGYAKGGIARGDVPRNVSALSRQFDELGKSVEVCEVLFAELSERLDPILSPVQTIEARPDDNDREPESHVVASIRHHSRNIYGLNERLRLLIDRIEV